MRLLLLLLLLPACTSAEAGATLQASVAPSGFWDHWGDGRAEIAGYRLRQARYGEMRSGEAIHVVVTEDFTRGARVKSDGGHGDEYPVLKLNAVRDFQTGVYDYNVMTSVFLPLDGSLPLGTPTKVSFSAQEWCGHAYEQLLPAKGGLRRTLHSYFDGEADKDDTHPLPADGLVGDAMPLLVRGLTGELLGPGEERRLPWLPTALDRRLAHRELGWSSAVVKRGEGTVRLVTPGGAFETYTVEVAPQGEPATTYWVEAAAPHRLVRWTRTDGEEGVLTGVIRAPYWQQHGEGDEALRDRLGLSRPGFLR